MKIEWEDTDTQMASIKLDCHDCRQMIKHLHMGKIQTYIHTYDNTYV